MFLLLFLLETSSPMPTSTKSSKKGKGKSKNGVSPPKSPLSSSKIANSSSTPERQQLRNTSTMNDDEVVFQTSPGKSTSPALGNILNSLRRSSMECADNSSTSSPRIEKYTPKITLGKYTQYSPRDVGSPRSSGIMIPTESPVSTVNDESSNNNNTNVSINNNSYSYNNKLYVPGLNSVLGQTSPRNVGSQPSPRYNNDQSPRLGTGHSPRMDKGESPRYSTMGQSPRYSTYFYVL